MLAPVIMKNFAGPGIERDSKGYILESLHLITCYGPDRMQQKIRYFLTPILWDLEGLWSKNHNQDRKSKFDFQANLRVAKLFQYRSDPQWNYDAPTDGATVSKSSVSMSIGV